jgi:hypothetical protein
MLVDQLEHPRSAWSKDGRVAGGEAIATGPGREQYVLRVREWVIDASTVRNGRISVSFHCLSVEAGLRGYGHDKEMYSPPR